LGVSAFQPVIVISAQDIPPQGLDQGTASFGIIAASLIALAAVSGAGFLATHLFKRRPAAIFIICRSAPSSPRRPLSIFS